MIDGIVVIVIIDNLQIGPRSDPARDQIVHRRGFISVVERVIKRIQKTVATALKARLFGGLIRVLGNPG
ncbi:hypothetical protein MEA186_13787 [Mesorhizobium amorphae CCNWGS0123]|uniref:Uncharacterized protein n=1 Tax=Mesorhizobium amorphae CCNWGS0123 TaxID=1082933 RepID=G6Y9Y5_9HYPH|nr:hypothetical protein A6B35_13150 [Mesorhizobium amorphae CCNWGS0123]EHH11496.1 hypothetical protein MEA186_13787 [Mesorhizobium amorphae CCNWGS0123]